MHACGRLTLTHPSLQVVLHLFCPGLEPLWTCGQNTVIFCNPIKFGSDVNMVYRLELQV